MQAAGLLKKRDKLEANTKNQVKTHRTLAKPSLVGTVTRNDSDTATIITEKAGNFITTRVKVSVNYENCQREDIFTRVKVSFSRNFIKTATI